MCVLAMLLLALAVASAETEVGISVEQEDGSSEVSTYFEVETDGWLFGEKSAGFVYTGFSSDGDYDFTQNVINYGDGERGLFDLFFQPETQYSMREGQTFVGSGDTTYNKHIEVYSPGFPSPNKVDYYGGGVFDTPEGINSYEFDGTAGTRRRTGSFAFDIGVSTDSDFESTSGLWINPFDD